MRKVAPREALGLFAGLVPVCAGVVLFALGFGSTLKGMGQPIGPYDEGLLLTNANLILFGQAPYRDFYSNYPPGVFLAIAGLWKLFGVSVAAERALGFAAHLVLALGAARLAARLNGKTFSTLTAGIVLIWLAWLGTVAFAWLIALALAVVACALLLRASEKGSRTAWLAAGLALGAVGCFRHDLLVYFVMGLLGLTVVWEVGVRRLKLARSELHIAGWLALGASVPLLLVWVPTLARAGFWQVFEDLYRTQVRDVLPARVLPMPPLLPLTAAAPLPFRLPAFLAQNFEGAVAVTLAGPVCALLLLALAPRLGFRSRLGPAILFALSVAVVPQMIGRTDAYHALYSVTPGLILVCAFAEGVLARGRDLWRVPVVVVALGGLLLFPVREHLKMGEAGPAQPWQQAFPRYGGLVESELARAEALAFVAANTVPGDPIFVGLTDHRRVFVDEMDLYFLTDRPGATRIMQFDPNVVNREDVQRRMAAEIEAKGTKVAILSTRFTNFFEPNESGKIGSSYLDEYLRAHFEVTKVAGPYQLMLRRREP